jgi:hypothetical protein
VALAGIVEAAELVVVENSEAGLVGARLKTVEIAAVEGACNGDVVCPVTSEGVPTVIAPPVIVEACNGR